MMTFSLEQILETTHNSVNMLISLVPHNIELHEISESFRFRSFRTTLERETENEDVEEWEEVEERESPGNVQENTTHEEENQEMESEENVVSRKGNPRIIIRRGSSFIRLRRQADCFSNCDNAVAEDTEEPGNKPVYITPDGNRMRWVTMAEVVDGDLASSMTKGETDTNEAIFEILSSEAVYLSSFQGTLQFFQNEIRKTIDITEILFDRDYNILFQYVGRMQETSRNLLKSLEEDFVQNPNMLNFASILLRHAKDELNNYIKYADNYPCKEKHLTDLCEANAMFKELLINIYKHPRCKKETLQTLLYMPVQRVLRYELLVSAVLKTSHVTDRQTWTTAHGLLKKLSDSCNNAVHVKTLCEEMLRLSQKLQFPEGMKQVPLMNASRSLTQTWTFRQKQGMRDLHLELFLFNDIIIIAKKKEKHYVIQDYCEPRHVLTKRLPEKGSNYVLLRLASNHNQNISDREIDFQNEEATNLWMKQFEGVDQEFEKMVVNRASIDDKLKPEPQLIVFEDDLFSQEYDA